MSNTSPPPILPREQYTRACHHQRLLLDADEHKRHCTSLMNSFREMLDKNIKRGITAPLHLEHYHKELHQCPQFKEIVEKGYFVRAEDEGRNWVISSEKGIESFEEERRRLHCF